MRKNYLQKLVEKHYSRFRKRMKKKKEENASFRDLWTIFDIIYIVPIKLG